LYDLLNFNFYRRMLNRLSSILKYCNKEIYNSIIFNIMVYIGEGYVVGAS